MKHFFHTFTPSLKQMAFMLLSLGLVLFVMMAFFGSCSPNNQGTAGSTVNNNPDSGADDDDATDSRRRSSDDDEPEGCDDDEGDPCKDDEDCMADCAFIYKNHSQSRNSCKNRGDETVGKLVTIHNRLMGAYAGKDKSNAQRSDSDVKRDLEKISNDDEDVGIDELKCYLQIGAGKYIDQIEEGLTPSNDAADNDDNKRSRLVETLKWFVEYNKEAAEVLADLNRGKNILTTLLLQLAEGPGVATNKPNSTKDCITGTEYKVNNPGASVSPEQGNKNNPDVTQRLWWFSSSNNLEIWYYDDDTTPNNGQKGEISLDSGTKNLYNALSCFHTDISHESIFTYSAEEDNEHIFDLAFNLLRDSCDEVTDSKKAGCARALMCWTSWQKSCGASNRGATSSCNKSGHVKDNDDDGELWDRAKEHESHLEKSSGGSNYNECDTEAFADFF